MNARFKRGVFPIEQLEARLLLSNDDIEIHRVGGFLGVSTNGFFVPFGPGNQTVDAGDGDDNIFVHETDDRQITINLGTGHDDVIVGNSDLDTLGTGTIFINAGTDGIDDLVTLDDSFDVGSDTYNVTESGGYIDFVKPGFGEVVRVAQTNIDLQLRCNQDGNTINVDSSVSINNTDQVLEIFTGDSTADTSTNTVNFSGTVSSLGELSVHGVSGADTLNLTGDVFTSSGTINFLGGNGTGVNLLNIDDTAATDSYTIAADSITMVDGAQTGTIDYNDADITLTSESTTAASSFVIQTPPNPIANGSDITINCGGGDDVINVGTGRLAPLVGRLALNGQAGSDAIAFNDSAEAITPVTYTLSNNQFDTSLISPVSISSFSSFLLEAGSGTSNITVGTGNGFFSSVQVVGNGGNDNFDITPSVGYEITALGGSNTATGDDLDLVGGGASRGELNVTGTGQGDYTFSNRNPVHFAGIETFTQPHAALGAPDLSAADDKGRSSADNITNLTTLTFGPSGATVVFNVAVLLYRDGVENATTTAPSSGPWSIDSTFPTGDATYAMTVRFVDPVTGLLSTPSAATNARVDTQIPSTPTAPNLISDTGQSTTDNITNNNIPLFNGIVEGSAIVSLRNSGTEVGNLTAAAGGSVVYQVAPSSALSDGAKSMTITQQDIAGNTSSPSPALSITIDTVAPNAPSAPDLLTSSDHGRFTNDNVTNVNTPTFAFNATELIRLLEGTTILADYAALPNVTSSGLPDGTHTISARSVDVAGNTSAQTLALAVTIDTIVPAPPAAPDMTDATDSGKLNNDNITKFTQPGFSGTVEANTLVSLKIDGVSVGTTTPSGTTYTAAPISALSNGDRSITVTQEDLSGNLSLVSPALVVTIDTIAPAAASVPDLPAAKDSGASSSDNVTNILSSSLVLAGPELIRLKLGSTTISDYLSPQTFSIAYTTDGSYSYTATSVDLAGNASAPSAGLNVTVDSVAPTVSSSQFLFQTTQTISMTFSEDVGGSLVGADLDIRHLPDNVAVAKSLAYSPNTTTFSFGSILPDGNYRATMSAGAVEDVAGNPLASNQVLDFFVLSGDANHDGAVDVTDLGILATNWQQSPRNSSQGDFNNDGVVDVTDLGILATHWQQGLPVASAPAAISQPPHGSRAIELIEPQSSIDMVLD
jgi:hypothetical protein